MDRHTEIIKTFGNRLRTRVCGICVKAGKILLIKHLNVGERGYLWAPPGGGLAFGESIEECLKREFKEEAGLTINVLKFMFVHEYLQPPLHSVELFFQVEIVDGVLTRGVDPELSLNNQMIEEVKFCDNQFLNSMPSDYFHECLRKAGTVENLAQLKGYHFST